MPRALQAACDPTWAPGEGRSRDPQTWDPLSLQFYFQPMHSIQALLADTPSCNIPFICQTTALLYLHYSIVILLLPQNKIDKFQFHYQDLDSSHWCIYWKNPNIILFPVFQTVPIIKNYNLPWVMQTRPMETLGETSDILKPTETLPKVKGHGT